jgi:hypothetical protein
MPIYDAMAKIFPRRVFPSLHDPINYAYYWCLHTGADPHGQWGGANGGFDNGSCRKRYCIPIRIGISKFHILFFKKTLFFSSSNLQNCVWRLYFPIQLRQLQHSYCKIIDGHKDN